VVVDGKVPVWAYKSILGIEREGAVPVLQGRKIDKSEKVGSRAANPKNQIDFDLPAGG
jgi:hypothetical protein